MNRQHTVAGRFPAALRLGLFCVFLLSFALVSAQVWEPAWLGAGSAWPAELLLVLSAATLLGSFAEQLPTQNVLLASILLGLIGGAAHTAAARNGLVFGPYGATHPGEGLLQPPAWSVAVIWVVVILTSRGVARLLLRPWRTGANYGLWVFGVTLALALLWGLSLETLAAQPRGLWGWPEHPLKASWHATPGMGLLSWALAAALSLVCVTPVLLNKKPVDPPAQYQPLLVWALLNLLATTDAARQHRWLACGLTACAVLAGLLVAFLTRSSGDGSSPLHGLPEGAQAHECSARHSPELPPQRAPSPKEVILEGL